MDDVNISLELHEQRLKTVEHTLEDLKNVQNEIRTMNETLVMLANEMKHTNEHIARHEEKIQELDELPKQRLNQLITALISACVGGIITIMITSIFK